MAVIVIGTRNVESELIRQISDSIGTGSGEVIDALRGICLRPEKSFNSTQYAIKFLNDRSELEDALNKLELNLSLNLALRRPVKIDFPDFLALNMGHSYHPNHGEPCDHLWVDPSDIHDQLCILAGYFMVLFHRKCFMQLKCFVNLRFV